MGCSASSVSNVANRPKISTTYAAAIAPASSTASDVANPPSSSTASDVENPTTSSIASDAAHSNTSSTASKVASSVANTFTFEEAVTYLGGENVLENPDLIEDGWLFTSLFTRGYMRMTYTSYQTAPEDYGSRATKRSFRSFPRCFELMDEGCRMVSVFEAHTDDNGVAKKLAQILPFLMKKQVAEGVLNSDDISKNFDRAHVLLKESLSGQASATLAVVVKDKLSIMFPDTQSSALILSCDEEGRRIISVKEIGMDASVEAVSCVFSTASDAPVPSPLLLEREIKKLDKFLVIGTTTFWKNFFPALRGKDLSKKIVNEMKAMDIPGATEYMFTAASTAAKTSGTWEEFEAEAAVVLCDISPAS